MSYGQKSTVDKIQISMDIISMMKKRNMKLEFNHPFHEKWSAGGGISVWIPEMNEDTSEEEDHEGSLSTGKIINGPSSGKRLPEYRIGISYWTKRFSEGTYISLECSHRSGNGAALILGGGYMVPIKERLGMSLGYERPVININNEEVTKHNGITVKLSYIF